MAVAFIQFGASPYQTAQAAATDNMWGWIWADPIGWTSVNSANVGACSTPPCGTYGLKIDTNPGSPTFRHITGFAWNDAAGWICFGASCAAVPLSACSSTPPTGLPGDMKAVLDPVGSPAPSTVDVHGWADVCNLGERGWISLNYTDPGGPPPAYSYRTKFVPSSGYFGNPVAPPIDSFGWNGNSDGTGFGYIDFKHMRLINPENTLAMCTNTADDDFNGKTDCTEASCAAFCVGVETTPALCSDLTDNDGDGNVDCRDTDCQALSVCDEVPTNTNQNPIGRNVCADGFDNNGNALIDCSDAMCTPAYSGCAVPEITASTYLVTITGSSCGGTGCGMGGGGGTITLDTCQDGLDNDASGAVDCAQALCAASPVCAVAAPSGDVAGIDETIPANMPLINYLCSDGFDDGKSDGKIDCDDASCLTKSTVCPPVWLQAKYGNVYGGEGISFSGPTTSRATYCLSTKGVITNFTSASGCAEPGTTGLTLPKSGTSFQGTLGNLDVQGILAGRYGTVVPYTALSFASPPVLLGGKVFTVTGDATLGTAAVTTTFANGAANVRGNGLLVVSGNLTIAGNLGYATDDLPDKIRNLASFGVIVKKNAAGGGGKLIIKPWVRNIVGAYFVEDEIQTGSVGTPADVRLDVIGLMAARKFNLQRQFHSKDVAAETFTFDARAVANPPPGMQDVGKTLPSSRDAF